MARRTIRSMEPRSVIVVILMLVGGFMTFDGSRALTVGNYLTPTKGRHAGELGPWSRIVTRMGMDPRSNPMRWGFVAIGTLHLAGAIAVGLSTSPWALWLAGVGAVSGLWYLPFGTLGDALVIVLILWFPAMSA